MTSQIAGGNLCVFVFDSFIRGYHAYKDMQEPSLGDVLRLEREITNTNDRFAVAVVQGSTVVGHIPYNTAPAVSHFMKRTTNKDTVEVIGAAVNRGAGYGMEIPDFMAQKTTLIDSENLSCRRNRIAIFFNKLVLIACPKI